ncbi:MAG TPA: glutamyl-tRNA reductase, partial [Arenibaculum sp.]|nr:glutamyl-tRNA reductase [Arenibaculum sp.]
VSIAAAAVQTARDLHGDLKRCAGLLLGTGDMGELMVESLLEAGLSRLVVSDPNDARGERAARRLGSSLVPFARLDGGLAMSDIVVTAAGLGRYILDAERIAAALRRRRKRPIFVIDTSAPADVDPAAAGLEHVFVYDLADLERVAIAGRMGREAAAAAAWAIVDEAVDVFLRGRAERAAVPAVAALRRHFEAERDRLLAEQPGLDAETATRLLINRLLHRPSEALRGMAADGNPAAPGAERLLGLLFQAEAGAGRDRVCDESEER